MIFYLACFINFFGSSIQHMAMTVPAPRRSPNHKGYKNGNIDYDITSPLSGGRSFPCRGTAPGPVYKSYSAGSDIDVHIGGSAKHGGGHCQFALTYDQKNFAVLKTVMGNCLTASVDYKVKIPENAPNGTVTFAWIWFNKKGNREIYMNCAEIDIESEYSDTSITGPKMVVANFAGYPTFPEGFANDYAKELYDNQPILSISPQGSYSIPPPKVSDSLPKIPNPTTKLPNSNPKLPKLYPKLPSYRPYKKQLNYKLPSKYSPKYNSEYLRHTRMNL